MVTSQQLYLPITGDMQVVDRVIREQLHSDVILIRQVAEYIIHSGGKRLRPALVLYAARACGYEGTHHCDLAVAVEFIHTATLLHDDVVDESELRRNNPTANTLFGNAAAVLVGDFLYTRAFQLMVGVNQMRVLQVMADATNIIAEGEVLQLMNCHDASVDIDGYLQVIHYKTAKLFEASTRLGAIISGVNAQQEQALATYGMHLGTAFQIIDDVLDYSSEEAKTGKHLGDDLAEGKPTLPLILVMQRGNPQQVQCVRHAIEEGGRDSFPEVLTAIMSTDTLSAAREYAQTEAQQAITAIEQLPASLFRDTLIELAHFAVKRDH